VQILLGLLIILILEVHRAHEKIQVPVQAFNVDILLHEDVCLLSHAVLKTELSIPKPTLGVFVFSVRLLTEERVDVLKLSKVNNIPLSMFAVDNLVVFSAQPGKLGLF
jgi:hypothetical protein